MVSKEIIINKLLEFANSKLTEMSNQSPIILLARPFIARAINNNIEKLNSMLSLIQDKNGMIDVDAIIGETIDNLLVVPVTKFANNFGGMEIGQGTIKFDIPFIGKQLLLDTSDIEAFKESLNK